LRFNWLSWPSNSYFEGLIAILLFVGLAVILEGEFY